MVKLTRCYIPSKKSFANLSLFALVASAFLSHASAATLTFTDRSLWEASVSGPIITENFNTATPGPIAANATSAVGSLSIQTINPLLQTPGFTQINDGTGGRSVDGSNYLQVRTDGSPVASANLIFPNSIVAWGMDFNQFADQTHVTFLDILEMPVGPHNTSGFIGFISDTSFNQIALTDPFISFSDIGMDNVSYVSAVPVPAAIWLFGTALVGFAGVARRRKAA